MEIIARMCTFVLRCCLLFTLCLNLPFLLPTSFLFRVYRSIVGWRIKKLGQHYKQVQNLDAIWLDDDDQNPAIINSLFVMEGKLDLQKLRNRMQQNLIENPISRQFSQRIETRYRRAVWVDDDKFDVKNHLIQSDTTAQNDQELHQLVSSYCSAPLDHSKPQWKVVLIPMEEKTIMLFRVHHVIGDGMAFVKLFMLTLVDEEPKDMSPVKFGNQNKFWKSLRAVFEGPLQMVSQLLMDNDENCLHGPDLTGEKRFAWSKSFDLDVVKKLKSEAHCTINDIMVTTLALSFRKYFLNQCPTIPDTIRAYIPVDMRRAKATFKLENDFTLIMLNLPLKYSDTMKCLKQIQKSMNDIKSNSEPLVNYFFVNYAMARLPHWITKFIFKLITKKCSIVLSNVPGPAQELVVVGHKMKNVTFFPPGRENVGMGISILSYNNQVSMGVMADSALIEEPQLLVDYFEECFEKLKNDILQN